MRGEDGGDDARAVASTARPQQSKDDHLDGNQAAHAPCQTLVDGDYNNITGTMDDNLNHNDDTANDNLNRNDNTADDNLNLNDNKTMDKNHSVTVKRAMTFETDAIDLQSDRARVKSLSKGRLRGLMHSAQGAVKDRKRLLSQAARVGESEKKIIWEVVEGKGGVSSAVQRRGGEAVVSPRAPAGISTGRRTGGNSYGSLKKSNPMKFCYPQRLLCGLQPTRLVGLGTQTNFGDQERSTTTTS